MAMLTLRKILVFTDEIRDFFPLNIINNIPNSAAKDLDETLLAYLNNFAFDQIFETMSVSEKTKYLFHASFLEIYNEEIRDLLGTDHKTKLELKENPDKGVYVSGLSMHKVTSIADCQVVVILRVVAIKNLTSASLKIRLFQKSLNHLYCSCYNFTLMNEAESDCKFPAFEINSFCENIMELGWKNRSTGGTLMNADSSRSHSIFTIYLEMIDRSNNVLDYTHIRAGKLNLVDLAGSERQTKTGAIGDRFKEATKINLSLSALGNVISALVDSKVKHIPYRDSKLTRLLQSKLTYYISSVRCQDEY
ncbi:Kinesin-like protein KIF17 [Schistosoma japonicum]|nr:Kinesin-like protein KIF17 [Schistosoma japonicum]